jgi:putative membrane protein
MTMMWNWAPWWHWLWMAGVWIVVVVVVAWAAVALFPRRTDREPRMILDDRLARGEIDVDEYRRLRDELDGRTPAGRARRD